MKLHLLIIASLLSAVCYAQTAWQITGNSNTASNNFVGTTNNKPLSFRTNDSERIRIASNGNVGIGTKTPDNTLHVFKGSAGNATGYYLAPLVVENSTHNYIDLLAPSQSEEGILFGNPISNASGEIIYNNSSTPNGFQFRDNNAITKMVLDSAGNIGLGTTFPGSYKMKLRINYAGLDLENSSTNADWEFTVASFDSKLLLIYNGQGVGSFSTSGEYTSASDERLKTNIKPMTSVLDKIAQLKPSTFQFKNEDDRKLHTGFIAQDVIKVFPSLADHTVIPERNMDVYSVNYGGFSVIAIKGIQELKTIVEAQQKQIEEQQEQIDELKQMVKTFMDKNTVSFNEHQ